VAAIPRLEEINRARCRRWIETRFTIEKMVDGYIEVYRRIIEGLQ